MKYIVNFRKSNRKMIGCGGVKITKQNKIQKTKDLIAGYQEEECFQT